MVCCIWELQIFQLSKDISHFIDLKLNNALKLTEDKKLIKDGILNVKNERSYNEYYIIFREFF